MSESDWEHVGVKVRESQKARWSEYLEESDHGSMSQLIRTAVEHYGSGTDVRATDAAEADASGAQAEHVAELVDTTEAMQSRLERLEGAIRDATDAMHEAAKDIDLGPEVYSALPTRPEDAMTAAELAAELAVDTPTVRATLQRLGKLPDVKRIDFETFEDQPEDVESGAERGYERREPLWFKEV